MDSNKLKTIIIFSIFLFNANSSFGQKNKKTIKIQPEYLIFIEATIIRDWKEDSCGYLGKRERISSFFKDTDFLIGKSKAYIDSLLGEPFNAAIEKNTFQYYYRVEARKFDKANNYVDACDELLVSTVKQFLLIDIENNKLVNYGVYME